MLWRSISARGTLCVALALLLFHVAEVRAQTTWGCASDDVAGKQAEFKRLSALKRLSPSSVTDEQLRAASVDYVQAAESCYAASFSQPLTIDDGPLMPTDHPDVGGFQTSGAKWGPGSLYTPGVDTNGPGLPGGTVTYSFMTSGVSMGTHSEPNLAFASLPGYQACFMSEIRDAFAAWSAVANIQFVEVPDNGVPFDAAGARGDIRIGAHAMDGPWGVLAHAYFPPPGGTSASGDIHFDRSESWSCSAGSGVIDVGVVAMHEIGHAIGLNHETRLERTALMNPYYNPNTASMLLADDIVGAAALYGRGVPGSKELTVNFGPAWGVWELDYGIGWRMLHGLSPKQTVSVDIDRNGVAERVVNFGAIHGVWIRWNNGGWTNLHFLSPRSMVAGDFDADGRGDIAMDFPPYGLWAYFGGSSWRQLLPDSPSTMTQGNIDGVGGSDLLVTRPGRGVWALLNSTTWVMLHPNDADVIVAGALDVPSGADDVLLQVPGAGIYQLTNYAVWSVRPAPLASKLLIGQLDGDARGEIVADFGPAQGMSISWNGGAWLPFHGFTTERLTIGDLDGNGRDDLAIRFRGAEGLWMFVNGSSWLGVHGYSPADLSISSSK
ncbi:MAG: matrixin family metalloprotease [Vicinamibacterales bacterium]